MSAQPALICPGCAYDVTRTLDDGIDTCPECGGAIDRDSCFTSVRRKGIRLALWYLVPSFVWWVMMGFASLVFFAGTPGWANRVITAGSALFLLVPIVGAVHSVGLIKEWPTRTPTRGQKFGQTVLMVLGFAFWSVICGTTIGFLLFVVFLNTF